MFNGGDLRPIVFFFGDARFGSNHRGVRHASIHNIVFSAFIDKFNHENELRKQAGLLPHLCFMVYEPYTSARCPGCHEYLELLSNEANYPVKGYRAKRCYGYVVLFCVVVFFLFLNDCFEILFLTFPFCQPQRL